MANLANGGYGDPTQDPNGGDWFSQNAPGATGTPSGVNTDGQGHPVYINPAYSWQTPTHTVGAPAPSTTTNPVGGLKPGESATIAPGTGNNIANLPAEIDQNILAFRQGWAQGLRGEALVQYANAHGGGGYSYRQDANVYGIPGGQGYIGVNGTGGLFYGAGDSGGGGGGAATPPPPYTALSPTDAGYGSTPGVGTPLGVSPFTAPTLQDLITSPGYQAGADLVLKGQQRSAAAKGSLLSGGTQVALGRDLTDYATTGYGNLFNERLSGYNASTGANLGTAQVNQSGYQALVTNALNQYLQRYRASRDVTGDQQFLAQLGLNGTIAGAPNPGTTGSNG